MLPSLTMATARPDLRGSYPKIDLQYELSIANGHHNGITVLEKSLEAIGDDKAVVLSNFHVLDFVDSPHGEETRETEESLEHSPMLPAGGPSKPPFSIRRYLEAKVDANPNSCLWPYLLKMVGTDQRPPPRDGIQEIGLCIIGSFSCLLILGALDQFLLRPMGYILLLPAFAAMAVVVFTKSGSMGALAQPPNVIFGHLASAVIGVTCHVAFGTDFRWISGPIAVCITIAFMSLTGTAHPAAGATALAAIYGGEQCTRLGYWFVLVPVFLGTMITVIMALLVNNLSPRRRYPLYWSM